MVNIVKKCSTVNSWTLHLHELHRIVHIIFPIIMENIIIVRNIYKYRQSVYFIHLLLASSIYIWINKILISFKRISVSVSFSVENGMVAEIRFRPDDTFNRLCAKHDSIIRCTSHNHTSIRNSNIFRNINRLAQLSIHWVRIMTLF